ncbi:MAG: hypothetical protein GYA36_22555 [Veillonellaceae bacterium]|nr:hypothetical protein [Veillonellaceae bacterium]
MSTKQEIEEPEVIKEKEQIYYSALLNGWINSRNEKDKQIITLSSLGIGLTLSIMTAVKDHFSICVLIGGVLIMGSFCYNIFLGLKILSINANYLSLIIKKEEEITSTEEQLDKLDNRFITSFKVAMILLCFLGAILGITFLTGDKMNEQKQTENSPQISGQNKAVESLQGLNELSPKNLNLLNTIKDSPIIVLQSANNDSVPKTSNQNNSIVNKEEK